MPLELGGITAHISCDDSELEAYEVKQEDGKTISCWIASEAGKTFAIHWGDSSASMSLSITIHVDGRLARDLAHRPCSSGKCVGIYQSRDEVRRYKFSNIVLTDDDAVARPGAASDELGTIQIRFRRVKRYTPSEHGFAAIKISEVGVVHEKSKKAGVHTVSFGEAEKTTPVTTWVPHGREEEPFATFIFRYRPLELLRANGVAPMPPPPSKGKKRASSTHDVPGDAGPSSSKRPREDSTVKPDPGEDEDDEDEDEVTFLREQMAMLQRRLEEAEAARRSRVVVKREVSPIRVPAASSQEVIDLT